jgi:hypothetical protein
LFSASLAAWRVDNWREHPSRLSQRLPNINELIVFEGGL